MQKKLIINIRPIISSLLKDWDGEGKQSQYIKHNKKIIFEYIENLINDISLPYDLQYKNKYKLDIENREVIVIFTWTEEENIYDWSERMKRNLQVISDYIWQKGLTCIIA
jgi:hypothetical protein